jgi:predicted Rossmann-fold nucleotide-binding protein
VRASDVLIAVGGGYGTLSEIALALKTGCPVVGLSTFALPAGVGEGLFASASAEEAVERAVTLGLARRSLRLGGQQDAT